MRSAASFMADESTQPVQHASGFLQTLRTVAWSFLGVRKASDHAQDASGLNPAWVVLAGLVGVVLFVGLLLLLVNWVVGSGVAA